MSYAYFENNKIIPVLKIESEKELDTILSALQAGGVGIVEITFRTSFAAEAIKIAVKKFPEMIVGAGTIINAQMCNQAIEAGAKFVVSPGYLSEIAIVCNNFNIPYIPGVATATEIMGALKDGYHKLKFFPAVELGGVAALKAYSAVFPHAQFIPTGGINEDDLVKYLSIKSVIAVGGTWMFKEGLESIKRLTEQSVNIVKSLEK